MKTLQELEQAAIKKLDTTDIRRIHMYIDNQIPLPSCILKRLEALRNRDMLKRKVNEEAEKRLIKITGPTQFK